MSLQVQSFHTVHLDAAGELVVDTEVVEMAQLRPDTWPDVAEWAGGLMSLWEGQQAIALGGTTPHHLALLGDYVTRDGRIERADGFYQRYRSAEGADG